MSSLENISVPTVWFSEILTATVTFVRTLYGQVAQYYIFRTLSNFVHFMDCLTDINVVAHNNTLTSCQIELPTTRYLDKTFRIIKHYVLTSTREKHQ